MTDDAVTPRYKVIALMEGTVPERKDEIASLWQKYNPDVVLVADAKQVTLNADKDRIQFDARTTDVFWLIGFSGWKAIECYSPAVVWSAHSGQTVADLLKVDGELGTFERDYKERRDGDCFSAELTKLCALTAGKAVVFPWLGITHSLSLWLWGSLPGVEPGPARGRSNGGLTPCI